MYFHNSLILRGAYFLLPLESKQEATSGWNFTKCISEVKVNQLEVKNMLVRMGISTFKKYCFEIAKNCALHICDWYQVLFLFNTWVDKWNRKTMAINYVHIFRDQLIWACQLLALCSRFMLQDVCLWGGEEANEPHFKGMFSDSINNIFSCYESEDINQKSLFPKFQLIPILCFQVMHDYVCFIAPIDYCVE